MAVEIPQPLYKNVIRYSNDAFEVRTYEVAQYEVLEEMFKMWHQAWDGWDAVRRSSNDQAEIIKIVAMAKKNGWEEAIMVYTGWNGKQLNQWLRDKMDELGEKYDG